MVAFLAKPVVAGLIFVAAAPPLPAIDIHRACSETAADDKPRSCNKEEAAARRKLIRSCRTIPKAYKDQCISAARPPAPSYIVLRDCIDNDILVHGRTSR